MWSAKTKTEVEPQLRVMRILTVALASGPLIFAAVAATVIPPPATPATMGQIAGRPGMMMIGLFAFVSAILMRRFVLKMLPMMARRSLPPTLPRGDRIIAFMTMMRTRLIVTSSILEGAAFFNIVCFMLERQVPSLGAGVLLALMILAQFPSMTSAEHFIEEQQLLLEQESR